MKQYRIMIYSEIIVTMFVFQFILFLLKSYVKPDNLNQFGNKMFTMTCMIVLAGLVVLLAKTAQTPLSVFPKKFKTSYIIFTCLFIVLFVTAPQNFTKGLPAIAVLFYGSVVTPIYEELLFRGYIWNELDKVHDSDDKVFLADAVLFGLWHIGYVYTNLINGDWFAVISKVLIGFGFGLILGVVRRKTKNCYSTMLLHGMMNIFL